MAVSSQQILDFLNANPGMSDSDIVSVMSTYSVSPAQMADALGIQEGEVAARVAATLRPGQTITLGDTVVQPQYQTTGSGMDEQIGPIENVYTYKTNGDPNYRSPVGSQYQQYGADGTFQRTGKTQKVDTSLAPILAMASFIPGVAPFAQGINALMAAKSGNVLGAIAGAAGLGGLTDVANAANFANAAKNKDVLGMVMSGANVAGVDNIGDYSIKDIGQTANTIKAIQSEDPNALLNAALGYASNVNNTQSIETYPETSADLTSILAGKPDNLSITAPTDTQSLQNILGDTSSQIIGDAPFVAQPTTQQATTPQVNTTTNKPVVPAKTTKVIPSVSDVYPDIRGTAADKAKTLVTTSNNTGPYVGYKNAFGMTPQMGDINQVADPRTLAFAKGLLGDDSTSKGFSALHPDISGIQSSGDVGTYSGFAAQIAPIFKSLTNAKSLFNSSSALDPALEKFLEGSVLKNRVFHGTADDISAFSGQFNKATGPGVAGWVTPDASYASRYAAGRPYLEGAETGIFPAGQTFQEGANVIPMYASIKNPLNLDDPNVLKMLKEEIPFLRTPPTGQNWTLTMPSQGNYVTDFAKQKGYDALQVLDQGYMTYAPLSGTQLKSAISNTGAYNPKDARLGFAEGGMTESKIMSDEELYQLTGSWEAAAALRDQQRQAPAAEAPQFTPLSATPTLAELKAMYKQMGATQARENVTEQGTTIDYIPVQYGGGWMAGEKDNRKIIDYIGQGMDATPVYDDAPKTLGGFSRQEGDYIYNYDPEGQFLGRTKWNESDLKRIIQDLGPLAMAAVTMGGGGAFLGNSLFGLTGNAAAAAGGALAGGINAYGNDQDILKGALLGGVSGAGTAKLSDILGADTLGSTFKNATLGDVTKAINFAKDPTLAGAANLASPYVTTNFNIGDTGFTTNDILKGLNTAQALGSGDNQKIFNTITGLVKGTDFSGLTASEQAERDANRETARLNRIENAVLNQPASDDGTTQGIVDLISEMYPAADVKGMSQGDLAKFLEANINEIQGSADLETLLKGAGQTTADEGTVTVTGDRPTGLGDFMVPTTDTSKGTVIPVDNPEEVVITADRPTPYISSLRTKEIKSDIPDELTVDDIDKLFPNIDFNDILQMVVADGTKTVTPGGTKTVVPTKTTTPGTKTTEQSLTDLGLNAPMPSQDPYANIKLMEELFGGDTAYKLRALGAPKNLASADIDALARMLRG